MSWMILSLLLSCRWVGSVDLALIGLSRVDVLGETCWAEDGGRGACWVIVPGVACASWVHWFLFVLVSFLLLWPNTWDDQPIRIKGLFWLTVSGSSVHCCLTPGPLGYGSTSWWGVHGRGSCLYPGNWEARKEEGVGVPISHSKVWPQWPNFLPLASL